MTFQQHDIRVVGLPEHVQRVTDDGHDAADGVDGPVDDHPQQANFWHPCTPCVSQDHERQGGRGGGGNTGHESDDGIETFIRHQD